MQIKSQLLWSFSLLLSHILNGIRYSVYIAIKQKSISHPIPKTTKRTKRIWNFDLMCPTMREVLKKMVGQKKKSVYTKHRQR